MAKIGINKLKALSHGFRAGMLFVVLLYPGPTGALAADCLSESYSLRQGRGVLDSLAIRELSQSEYEGLKNLFQRLEGAWEGAVEELTCKGEPGDNRNEIIEYAVNSVIRINSSGKFIFDSNLSSREKRVTRQESITLYLTPKHLSAVSVNSGSNIEIAQASADELIYVRKHKENKKQGSLPIIAHEWMTAIKIVDDSTVKIEKTYYRHGRLISHSSWFLEAD